MAKATAPSAETAGNTQRGQKRSDFLAPKKTGGKDGNFLSDIFLAKL